MATEHGYNFNFNQRFVLKQSNGEAFSFVKEMYPTCRVRIGEAEYEYTGKRSKVSGRWPFKTETHVMAEVFTINWPFLSLSNVTFKPDEDRNFWIHRISNLEGLFDLYGIPRTVLEEVTLQVQFFQQLKDAFDKAKLDEGYPRVDRSIYSRKTILTASDDPEKFRVMPTILKKFKSPRPEWLNASI